MNLMMLHMAQWSALSEAIANGRGLGQLLPSGASYWKFCTHTSFQRQSDNFSLDKVIVQITEETAKIDNIQVSGWIQGC